MRGSFHQEEVSYIEALLPVFVICKFLYRFGHEDSFADGYQNLCFLLPLLFSPKVWKEHYVSSPEYLHRFLIEATIHTTRSQP